MAECAFAPENQQVLLRAAFDSANVPGIPPTTDAAPDRPPGAVLSVPLISWCM